WQSSDSTGCINFLFECVRNKRQDKRMSRQVTCCDVFYESCCSKLERSCVRYGQSDYWLAKREHQHLGAVRKKQAVTGFLLGVAVALVTILVSGKETNNNFDWTIFGVEGIWAFWLVVGLETAAIVAL